jgi:hypothetical protein
VFSVISAILALYGTRWGLGFHIWDIKPEWVATYKKVRQHLIPFRRNSNSPIDRRFWRRAVCRYRYIAEDLGVRYLPRSVSVATKHKILLDYDRIPKLLVDFDRIGNHLPMHVRLTHLGTL